MKVSEGLFDLVVVFHAHSWVNTKQETYRLRAEDDLQVRMHRASGHAQVNIIHADPRGDREKYVSILLQAAADPEIDERSIIIRGFVKEMNKAGLNPSYLPRLVILTRQGLGWDE